MTEPKITDRGTSALKKETESESQSSFSGIEPYLRLATNYGLAIFLVVYYVLWIHPRDQQNAAELNSQLSQLRSEIESLKSEQESHRNAIDRFAVERQRGHDQLMSSLTQIQGLVEDVKRTRIPTGPTRSSVESGFSPSSDEFLDAAIQRELAEGVVDRLVDALARRRYRPEQMADAIRLIVCEEFHRHGYDLRSIALAAPNDGLDTRLFQSCKKLADAMAARPAIFDLSGTGNTASEQIRDELNTIPTIFKHTRLYIIEDAWRLLKGLPERRSDGGPGIEPEAGL